ncbi:taurine ABC transporter substrate-binding protein [Corynebacterium sp. 320]|uniref:taurine ABC transporter substrate-binding protein n=1 Tax=Corynebacterium TaxID=1716 RepID=UPI00125CB2D9|nr:MULTISPECIES: ABC transporter substrate-binding protein [Corynebacterium]KAB1502799.1 taurine ABC transporter substrate-binding protein [Corynebacterium sp. 320]KAB1550460.1 taurine ABC transporter substrate-binding protein [Corynebacterium sp. 319]KAB1554809.1 taurine ABC transporter substrate-binding protein [Corynebacterium sp. 321]KAB3526462.1 taurine ABC transporter substrate-binding protein [Corynebacterium sp. 250]KAB3539781.1 taurine ABC transporter substrate-binding protein [Coryne
MNHAKNTSTKPAAWKVSLATMVAAGTVFTQAACVGGPATPKASASECPVHVNEDSATLRIAYLGSPLQDLYVYDQGYLDACLPNVDVQWARYPTGQDIVQGFAAQSVDVGGLGSTPAAKALSSPLDLDVLVPRVNTIVGSTEALVAKNAKSIKDLKGKKIAVPFSSTSHYSLLKALEDAGLDPSRDVTITNISPDKLPAAWSSPDIEAAYVWDPTLQTLKEHGGHVVLTSEDVAKLGAPTFNVTMVSRPWAEKHAGVLDTWLKLQDYVTTKAADADPGYVEAVSIQSGMKVEDGQRQVTGQEYIPGNRQPEELESLGHALYDTADFLSQQSEVSGAHEEKKYVDATTQWPFYRDTFAKKSADQKSDDKR